MSLQVHQIVIGVFLLLAMLSAPSLATAAPSTPAPADDALERVIVVARSDADYNALRSEVERAGGSIVQDMRDGGMLVATGASGLKSRVQATGRAKAVAKDHIETLVQPSAQPDMLNSTALHSRTAVDAGTSAALGALGAAQKKTVTADPALSFPGLMWNLLRIHAPEAWQSTTGSGAVKVGVADTGLDFTHSELAPQISGVVDFTVNENPPICKTFFPNPFTGTLPGLGDADMAARFGGPEKTDWYGHGSWIGGNIAAALDGQGINGIAPKVKLVSLKISQWCGSAYDSTIMDAILYAANHHIDVVSISFGGYLNPADPDQLAIYLQYVDVVQYARQKGTVIVAAAGNEHVRVGPGGQVLSHGLLTNPSTPAAFTDLFGMLETPGGVQGVVDVSSTGNVVAESTAGCVTGGANSAVCKPSSDPHQQAGVGKLSQLSYFSNYGPRIDVAAPGGARKFNLPFWDNGGTPGFPYTSSDLTTAFEAFSTTSNWALQIPCFTFTGGGFPANQCYTGIQGTSMATPHASAVLALIASKDADARHHPDELISILKSSARHITGNKTQVISATDLSTDDQTGKYPCTTGYCHLGGVAVPDNEAYGAGIVDAQRGVSRAAASAAPMLDPNGAQTSEN